MSIEYGIFFFFFPFFMFIPTNVYENIIQYIFIYSFLMMSKKVLSYVQSYCPFSFCLSLQVLGRKEVKGQSKW